MLSSNQHGNVVMFLIIGMALIVALGGGMFYMTTISTQGEIGANNLNRAYRLALAGKDYALTKNLGVTTGRVFTFTSGDKFSLVISGNTVESTGIVNEGTPFEARRKIRVTKSGFSSKADISFARDIAEFAKGETQTTTGFVNVDTTASEITLGQLSMSSQFGAIWYGGSATEGDCVDGKCNFGAGIRAFFVFEYAAGSTGDGFTFAFFNGTENDIHAVGGDSGRGELMGYAGDSRTTPAGTYFLDGRGGRGIQPPKMAVEFDVYGNSGSGDVCSSGSRRDGNESPSPRNHAAYVFWGDNANFDCRSPSTVGSNTYDDNRHNKGSDAPDQPKNSIRPSDGADTSYFNASSLSWPSNWLLSNSPSNVYAFRVEVTRSLTPSGGNYNYTIKSWVKQCATDDITCPTYNDQSDYANTKTDYTADVPNLTRTIAINSTLHEKFSTFFYGWTAATGGATQKITIKNFKMYFKK